MTTWRNLRQQTSDLSRGQQVRRLMRSMLEQYGADLRQHDLTECMSDLDKQEPAAKHDG